jgi:serine protease Do
MAVELLTRAAGIDSELHALTERVAAGVVAVHTPRGGSGSGVVWGPGVVVTNHHVASGARAEVALDQHTRLPARVVASDSAADLAVLQIEVPLPRNWPNAIAVGDPTLLRPGELVIAVGNPLGERNAVTLGVVAGPGLSPRPKSPGQLLRVAITLRPGNSGGALADMQGRLVGIPNMVIGRGVGLAVPTTAVEELLERAGGTLPGGPPGVRWV